MSIFKSTRQAYSEVDTFLKLLNIETINKIPIKLREFLAEEKDNEYVKTIDANIPIKEQGLKREALAIIAWLNLQYWCEDEKEKERLKEIYLKNDKTYKEILQVAFNPDVVFSKNNDDIVTKETENSHQIKKYKNNIFSRLINSIVKVFSKRY